MTGGRTPSTRRRRPSRNGNAAKRGRRLVAPGREATEPDPQLWDQRASELEKLVDRLRSVPVEGRDTWATVARQTAGVLGAWSNATEDSPGDLAAAAEALTRPDLVQIEEFTNKVREVCRLGDSDL